MRLTGWLLIPSVIAVSACFAAPEMRSLSKGQHSAMKKATEVVIRNPEEWQKLWAQANPTLSATPAVPKVDFGSEMVLAVFQGQKPSGGYAIEISGVQATDKALIVQVRRTEPSPDAIVTAVITSPYHIVAVPKSSLPVKFVAAAAR